LNFFDRINLFRRVRKLETRGLERTQHIEERVRMMLWRHRTKEDST